MLRNVAAVNYKQEGRDIFYNPTMHFFFNFLVRTDVPVDTVECLVFRKVAVSLSPSEAFSFKTDTHDIVFKCFTLFVFQHVSGKY